MKQENNKDQSARDRLLDAALDVFGRYGYESATTRMIAAQAGTNVASIPYYFNNKEGLYTAMVEKIVSSFQSGMQPLNQEILQKMAASPTQEEACALIEKMLNAIITFMLGNGEIVRFARIILREHLYPSTAYELIFTGFMEPMNSSLAALLRICQPDLDERKARLTGVTMIGQILVFRIAREALVRKFDMEGYSDTEILEIREIILQNCRAALTTSLQTKSS